MYMMPFDKNDYKMFAGVESDAPLISHVKNEDSNFCLIVDDNFVEAIFMDSNGFLNDTTVQGEFPTKSMALLFALQVNGSESPIEIEAIGEDHGGTMHVLEESLQAGRV